MANTKIRDEQITSEAAADGHILTADGSGGAAWETPAVPTLSDHDHSGDAGDGGTFDAANLTSGEATDGQVLTADGSGGAAWEDAAAVPSALDDLTDVDTTTTPPTDGQSLTWDNTNSLWKPGDVTPGASALNDLTDVDTTTTPPTDGQALVWSGGDSLWVPGDVAAAGGGSADAPIGVSVYRSSALSLSSGAGVLVTFDSEYYDEADFHEGVTNPSRITAPEDGRYIVGYAVAFAANSSGYRGTWVKKNDTDNSFLGDFITNTGGITPRNGANAVMDLEAGDYLELYAYQNSGGNLDLTSAIFWMQKIITPASAFPLYTQWLPDAPPETPHDYDDEFDGDTLDGDWTVNAGTIVVANGHADFPNSGRITRAVPSGNFTVWAKVSWSGEYVNYHSLFFALGDGATWTSGNAYAICPASYSSTSGRMEIQKLVNGVWNSTPVNIGMHLHTAIYLRWQYSSGTIYASFSTDGIGWRRIYSVALTPQILWIYHMGHGMRVEFVRFSTDIASDALLPGRMVPMGGSGGSGSDILGIQIFS